MILGRRSQKCQAVRTSATGEEECRATIVIRDKTLQESNGHLGNAALQVVADGRWWLGFVTKDRNLLCGLLRRRLRLKGNMKLLSAFGKCFSS